MSAGSELKSGRQRVCVVQPWLTSYSLPVFLELARLCEVDLFFSPAPKGSGFGEVTNPAAPKLRYFPVKMVRPWGERIGMWQRGLLGYISREKPDAIILSANPRQLTFWAAAGCGRWLGIRVYAHGHGPYKKKKIGWAYRGLMKTLLRLVTSYICYAPAVRRSFLDFGFDGEKLVVADNSLMNLRPVCPEEKTGAESGILFIGRLREKSHLERLIAAARRLREDDGMRLSESLTLHVIGGGEQEERLREAARDCPWICFHGELYDEEKIRQISLDCFAGCYPGNAGLSLVHMMSLSLPVVTHDDLHAHGPEVSFLRDGASGLLYDHANPGPSLYSALRSLADHPERVAGMRQQAFADYLSLTHPSLAERFCAIVCDGRTQAMPGLSLGKSSS